VCRQIYLQVRLCIPFCFLWFLTGLIFRGRRQERGTIAWDRMTEHGWGGDYLMDTFELHKITSLPYFRAPRSSESTGTYSACVLGVRLRCQCHGQLVFQAQSEGWLTGVLSIFLHLGIVCNFNILFNFVVEPTHRRNLHKQPLHHLMCLVNASRSTNQDDTDGTSSIVLPCHSS
jgi:hypothetical protein